MDKEEKYKTPKRGPMGHGRMRGPAEKPKDFKNAIKRLLKELKNYKIIIVMAVILSAISSVLSILGPDRLSSLTDEITKGLVINKDNIEKISTNVTNNLNEERLKNVFKEVLAVDISNEKIATIMMDSNISNEDKMTFTNIFKNINMQNSQNADFSQILNEIPTSILEKMYSDTIYEGINITTSDKIELVKLFANSNGSIGKENLHMFNSLPESIKKIIFKDFVIDGVTISSEDEITFITKMSELKEGNDADELYKKLDTMPESIKEVIKPKMDFNAIKYIVTFLIALYLCSAIFNFIQSLLMTQVSNKFAQKLRTSISKKINKLPLKYFDNHKSGDILSRVTNDVDTIAQTMNQSISGLVGSITLFIGTIIMMFVTNWILALTAIFSTLIGFVGMALILKKSQKYFVERQKQLGNLNGHIEEIYSGLNVVKVYNGKNESSKKFDLYNKKVCESNKKSQFLSGLMHPMMNFIGNFGYVAVCIVGALLTMNDVITFGVIVAFMTYVRLFTSPLTQIAQAMTSLQSTAAASERVFEFVDDEEMPSQENVKKKLEKDKVKGKIEFENVIFQYDNNDKPTIKNFTATALPGQKIAIVGPTGAGKTTMVNLLMKFYDINSGDIKIDGVSTKDLTRENVHELFTMVLQDTWLYDGTIKENIVYNRENVSDDKVEEVCKEIGLHHFIKTLPKGYNSTVSESDSISEGQRQLLTIARGMIEDSPFLILDEATSNVDTRTEELVQEAMDKLTKGKTSFIIAHRLSTIKNADLILVMKEGNIIEQGNHEELMNKKGFYAELYNSQFEL